MDEHRRAFRTFLALHAHKATPTDEPAVHLLFLPDEDGGESGAAGARTPTFRAAALAVDAPLLRLSRDEVCEELDTDSELVRWLLEQMRSYDCTRQRIVALVFDRSTVLSEVLRMPPSWEGAA